jgi:hypothetical protein
VNTNNASVEPQDDDELPDLPEVKGGLPEELEAYGTDKKEPTAEELDNLKADPAPKEDEPQPAATPEPDPVATPATENQPAPQIQEENAPDFEALVTGIDDKIQEKQTRVTEILGELETLAEQLDGGELGQGKYDTAKLKLERELRDIDVKVNQFESQKATIVEQSQNHQSKEQMAFEQRWSAEVNTFLQQPENSVFNTNPQVSDLFDKTLEGMQAGGLLADLSMPQVLAAVRAQVALRVELPPPSGKVQTPAKNSTPRNQTQIPPNLSQIPAVATNDTAESEFSYLDDLGGIERDKAFAKLTPSQKERYLNGD